MSQEIIQTIKKECHKGDFDFNNVEIKEADIKNPHFKMKTHLVTGKTIIEYNPEYEKDNPNKTKLIIRDGIRHEIDHHKYFGFEGCPRNKEYHCELIFEPLSEELMPEYTSEDCHYLANALEDTILHKDLSKKFNLEGIKNFFKDIGESINKFSPFYEAHVKLNLYLWGNKKQKREVAKFYTHPEKVKEVLDNFLEKIKIREINTNSGNDRKKVREFLNDKENWEAISKIYGQEFSKLMEPRYALPLMNHSGAGTKGRESEDSFDEGNEFDKEMKTRKFKNSRIQKAYHKNEQIPKWMDQFESLNLLYESLARKLEIKSETYTESVEMPTVWYQSRKFNPEKDDFKYISFDINEKGKFEIRKKILHESMPLEVKISQRGFPNSRFGILDTSGSMAGDPDGGKSIGNTSIIPWGDNSRYHYALLSWYGFLEYLKQHNLLKQTNIILANFGTKTSLGRGLEKAKRNALNPQFSDSTNIDFEKIESFFEGRNNLIFTISDGMISNWNKIKEEFINSALKHQYFHLQIGDENQTSKEMRQAGLKVERIKNVQDLASKTIDLTDKLLRSSKC